MQLWLIASDEPDKGVRSTMTEMILQRLFEQRKRYTTFSGETKKAWDKLMGEPVFTMLKDHSVH